MNPKEFEQWCQSLNFLSVTKELIVSIRSAPPARRVQGRANNVSGTYPSRKMGVTIQFESHKVELWAIYMMEHDDEVLEYYDQPPAFKIAYTNQSGRRIGHYHTPDFFVLRKDEAAWEEWKTEEQIQRLAEKYPTRYQRTGDGSWRCPPGDDHARSLGLKYRVRTDAELDAIFIQNLMFLEDYLGYQDEINPVVQERIQATVKASPGLNLAVLLANEQGVCANDVLLMVVQGQIYVDLKAFPLAQHSRIQLYGDLQTYLNCARNCEEEGSKEVSPYQTKSLISGTRLMWDGRLWTLVNLGEKVTTLMPSEGQPLQLPSTFFLQLVDGGAINLPDGEEEGTLSLEAQARMNKASVSDLREANRRFNLVQAYLQWGTPLDCEVSGRTLRRWSQRFREAEMNYGCGYIGLLPRTRERGNRASKAPSASRELLDTFIGSHFETTRQAPAASVYRAYQKACEEKNILPLSVRTFYQRIKQRPRTEQTEKRQGAKAAYPTQPWHWELTRSTPPHGDRPLSIVHIDHTQLDIELRSEATGRLLGRPWATLMVDAYSRRILAVYLTFDAPSYRSCMMAIRICVGRFGRFPQAIVVDGGKEFHSVYFDTLLARYHCTKKTRPGAKPRFGSVIERLFGTTNTQFIYNLLGNTQATKQVREMTAAVDPKKQAVWTLGDLYTYLKEYAYCIYDQNEHPALSLSPRTAYEQGLMQTGERLHRHIAYDEDFILSTHPSTRSGLALVHPGRGIKLNYLYYWSDAFRNPMVERTKVPVRYDPFDMGIAYAFVQGRWVKCISQYYSIFSGHSEKELLLAAAEIKQQAKLTRTTAILSAKPLADFLANVTEHEALLLQRWRDLEAKNILNAPEPMSQNATVSPTAAPPLPPERKNPPTGQKLEVFPLDFAQIPIFEEYR